MNKVLMMLDNEGTTKCQNFHRMRKSYMQGKLGLGQNSTDVGTRVEIRKSI